MDLSILQTVLNQVVLTPEGQMLLLSITIAGEVGDDDYTYKQLMDFLDEPELRKMAIRHHEDEARHAGLFHGCLERLGLKYAQLPDSLKVVQCISKCSGTYFRGIHSPEDMVDTCAMTYVIEQRGIERYSLFASAFDGVDKETAEIYRAVILEEHNHLDVCAAVGRHYAQDEAAWKQALARASIQETNALTEFGVAFQCYLMELRTIGNPTLA